MSLKPIVLWGHASGPNPWKVAIVLEELGIPYEMKMLDMGVLKQEPYTLKNPNGRVPAIDDPNTGITLWESGAIIQYLVEKYDKEGKISFSTEPEKYYLNQWLQFQMSGQGPYYGQAAWFTFFHHEQVESAKERYIKEIERVMGVLDGWLQKHEYLVGDKCTYADLAFMPWGAFARKIDVKGVIPADKYKAYDAWIEKILARPAVKKVFADKDAAAAKH